MAAAPAAGVSTGRFAQILTRSGRDSTTGRLIAEFFECDARHPALELLLSTIFSPDDPLVFLPHQGVFAELWGSLLRAGRVYPSNTPNGDVVLVRYTRKVVHINGQPLVGDVYYPALQAIDIIAAILTRRGEQTVRFTSVFDIPLRIVRALLSHSIPEALYDHFCSQYIDLDTYDTRFVDVFRGDSKRLEQFYVEPVAPAASGPGLVMVSDYEKLVGNNRLGEWWSRKRRSEGTLLVITLFVLFDLECEMLQPKLSARALAATRVERLQNIFPFALWLVFDEEPPHMREYSDELYAEAPEVAQMIQAFIDVAQLYIIDQGAPLRSDMSNYNAQVSEKTRSMCRTLRNIRVCMDPHVDVLERFENTSLGQVGVDTHSREARAQRMSHFAAARVSLSDFVYGQLVGTPDNMVEVRALLDWIFKCAYERSRTMSAPDCTYTDIMDTPAADSVRNMVDRVSRHYLVLTFFGRDGWPAATLFSLRCTMKAVQINYPEIGLADPGSHYLGHCQCGPYVVMERQLWWMVVHATSALALTSQRRCYQKTTPNYHELLRTYFSRMDTKDEVSRALRETPTAFSFMWSGAPDATPRLPATLHPNLFSHMCFVHTMCEWLDVPPETTDKHKWRLAVPPPDTPGFGATRLLHRLVDVIYQGGIAMLADAGCGRNQYWVDDDDLALNAIKSYLQLDAPHTVSIKSLHAFVELFSEFEFQIQFEELEQLLHAIDAGNRDCAKHIQDWIAEYDTNNELQNTLLPFMTKRTANLCLDVARRNRRFTQASGNLRQVYDTHDGKPPAAPSRRTGAAASNAPEGNLMETTLKDQTTDTLTCEMLLGKRLCDVNEATQEQALTRVALVPDRALISRLSPDHSLRVLAERGAPPRELLAHINMLLYEPAISGALDPRLARRLVCDLKVGGSALSGARLFSVPRYMGARDEALRNFHAVHLQWERLILTVHNDPIGRVLAYNSDEPRDQLYALMRHLDFRHTVGDATAGQRINVAIDHALAQGPSAERLVPTPPAAESEPVSAPPSPTATALPSELPICMGSAVAGRSNLYPSDSMVLITTTSETNISARFTLYIRDWEFASHMGTILAIDSRAQKLVQRILGKYDTGPTWLVSTFQRAQKKKRAVTDAETQAKERLEAAAHDFDSAMSFLFDG